MMRVSSAESFASTAGGVDAAHALYQEHGSSGRDDALAMQHLIPNWRFDPKRPCMVR